MSNKRLSVLERAFRKWNAVDGVLSMGFIGSMESIDFEGGFVKICKNCLLFTMECSGYTLCYFIANTS